MLARLKENYPWKRPCIYRETKITREPPPPNRFRVGHVPAASSSREEGAGEGACDGAGAGSAGSGEGSSAAWAGWLWSWPIEA
jgi:hypothetical protein